MGVLGSCRNQEAECWRKAPGDLLQTGVEVFTWTRQRAGMSGLTEDFFFRKGK